MKSLKLFVLGIILVGGFYHCTKPTQDSYGGCVFQNPSDQKSTVYQMFVRIGHSGKNCQGCVRGKDGNYVHIDCQGYGNTCNAYSQIVINQSGTDITATTVDTFDLTSEDVFLMPDRSLNYTDANNNRIFLNIPEQLVYRDTTTLQFTFTGLFFSNSAAYNNN